MSVVQTSDIYLAFTPILAQQANPPRGIDTGGAADTAPAQPGLGTPTGTPNGAPPAGPNMMVLFLPMLVIFGLMIFMSSRAQKKQKREHENMLSAIGRHDRVETIGGIIGTVAELRDAELVLKVDESTNTKIHVSRSAIKGVLKQSRRDNNAPATTDA